MAAALHVHRGPDRQLPVWLARLHRSLPVGEQVQVRHWTEEGNASARTAPPAAHVVTGAGFKPVPGDDAGMNVWAGAAVHIMRDHTLPDWVGPEMTALLVGLNPSPASAEAGVNFARSGNRFWPALLTAGLATVDRDPEHALVNHGLGFTDLVKRTTRTAAELRGDDYRVGLDRLEALVRWLAPERVVIVGLTGWRAARDRRATAGWQPDRLAGRPVYLMPNPSGLNAHTSLEGFVHHFQEAAADWPTGV